MKKLVLSLLITSTIAVTKAQQPPLPSCLTNLDVYCLAGNQVSTTTGGTNSSSATNQISGMNLLNTDGSPDGTTISFSGACSASDQTIAVIIAECNDNQCGLFKCSPGAHPINVTLPAGCDTITGYISTLYGGCCAITWNVRSCHPCTPGGGGQ